MEKTFFDDDLVKNNRLVSCPHCRNKFKISLEQVEVECECGEKFCAQPVTNFPEDFVWHPSERY